MYYLFNLSKSAARWLKINSERGVTAIEYGILAALISLVIIAAVTLIGTNLNAVFNEIATKVAPVAGG